MTATDSGKVRLSEEQKFRIGDQWYYRGNRSPSWFAVASRPDGSCQNGIMERVQQSYWPWLEVIAELNAKLAPRPTGALPEMPRFWYANRPTELGGEIDNGRLNPSVKLIAVVEKNSYDALLTAAASIEAENQRLRAEYETFRVEGGCAIQFNKNRADEFEQRAEAAESELSSLRGRLAGVEKIVSEVKNFEGWQGDVFKRLAAALGN